MGVLTLNLDKDVTIKIHCMSHDKVRKIENEKKKIYRENNI